MVGRKTGRGRAAEKSRARAATGEGEGERERYRVIRKREKLFANDIKKRKSAIMIDS